MASRSQKFLAAPVKTSQEFLRVVEHSRLVAPEELQHFHLQLEIDPHLRPTDLAARLVQGGHLTLWQSEQLLAGKTEFFLGRYKFLDRLGVGGMGAVFKAEHEIMGRVVALKMIRRRLLKDEKTHARFLREIRAVAVLNHPHIVTAYDADRVGEVYFLAMEFIDGRDLGWWVKQHGPFAAELACEFCRQAALGLQHAHERGLVHRDIKPSNLLVVREPPPQPATIRILDFGLSRLNSEGSLADPTARSPQNLDDPGQTSVVGTFGFMAPEQFRRPPQTDIRGDVFSLGCTLFYLLTGRLPFAGSTDEEYLANLLQGRSISARSLNPDVPPQVEAVLRKMLAVNPDDRFQTPAEVAENLWPVSAAEMQDFVTGRMTVQLPRLPKEKLPEVQPSIDATLEEFDVRLTNAPTSMAGSALDDLMNADELPPAAPFPGAQIAWTDVRARYRARRIAISLIVGAVGALLLIGSIVAIAKRFTNRTIEETQTPSAITDEMK